MAGIGGVPAAAADGGAGHEAIRRAARGLEAVLIRQMLVAMEKAQLEQGLFGQSAGAGARQTAFDLLLSEALAEREPLGLASRIADELARPSSEGDSVRSGSHIVRRRGQVSPLGAEEIYGNDWRAAAYGAAPPENDR